MTNSSLLAAVHAAANEPLSPAASSVNSQPKETSMADPKADTPAVSTVAELTAAFPTLCSTVRLEGATAERSRISAILGSDEAKGRSTLAQHLAFETDMSADAAKTMLGKAEKQAEPAATTDPLSAAMSQVKNPQVGADGGDQTDDQQAAALAGNIVSSYLGKPAKAA